MHNRSLSIFLTMLIGFQAIYGGLGGAVVLCLGGGHEHQPSEMLALCELACGHAEGLPGPVPADQHGEDCDCVDIEIEMIELLSLLRVDSGSLQTNAVHPTPTWIVTELGHGLSWTGPPGIPQWSDPGSALRLAIVSTTRLIL